jgi:hypothetical protein
MDRFEKRTSVGQVFGIDMKGCIVKLSRQIRILRVAATAKAGKELLRIR